MTIKTTYELEWERQNNRADIPPGHLPVHRWYLRIDDPSEVEPTNPPGPELTLQRAIKPGINFYRFLYHTAGEEFLWGDRRRMSDEELLPKINDSDCHVMVLYDQGTPAGFFEANFENPDHNEIRWFALLPGFIGRGLGGYLLNRAIVYTTQTRAVPLILDTCTLDHSSALENYRKRGFTVYREADEIYPDPRLDGTIRRDAGQHVPFRGSPS